MTTFCATYRLNGIIATVTVKAESETQAREQLVLALRLMAAQGPERLKADQTGERSGNDKGT